MAISGDLNLITSFALHSTTHHHHHPLRPSAISPSKIPFGGFSTGVSHDLRITSPFGGFSTGVSHDLRITTSGQPHINPHSLGARGGQLSLTPMNQDAEGFLLNSVNMSFLDRLSLVWKILFPTATSTKKSNARVAKQRLKMILYSDRCAVSDEAKQRIVSSIMEVLSEFVEIESQDKVQLTVSADPALGTMYSVIVPVRRVKPQYHDSDKDYNGKIASIEYKDKGETSGSVDVKFQFFGSK